MFLCSKPQVYIAEAVKQPVTIEEKIEHYFPENPELFKQIALAESSLEPTAYNPEFHKGCQGSFGLMQIACVNYSGDSKDLFDVDVNLQIARQVYETQGVMAWGPCKTGKISCSN